MKYYFLFPLLFVFAKLTFAQQQQPISFEKTEHLFTGKLSEKEHCAFKFQNVSKMPISMLNVKTDCECITVKLPLQTIMPDSFGYIEVDFQPNLEKEPKKKDSYMILVGNNITFLPAKLKIGKDIDGDGVTDNEDQCPKEHGPKKWQGCPPPPPPPELATQEPDPNKLDFPQVQPKPLNMDEIIKMIGYPLEVKEAGIEGRVFLKILVDENGNYVRHTLLKSAHPLLIAEVEKYVNQLKFTPAMLNGKAIPFWLNVPFYFKAQ